MGTEAVYISVFKPKNDKLDLNLGGKERKKVLNFDLIFLEQHLLFCQLFL
jgi:hypothetical protein